MTASEGTAAPMRQRLIDAFFELYRDRPIERVTVRAVCERVPCNRSTFYAHFEDMYELRAQFEATLVPDPSVIRSEGLEAFLQARGERLAVVLGEHGDPAYLKRVMDRLLPRLVARYLAAGAKDAAACDLLAQVTLSAVAGAITHWLSVPERPPAGAYIARVRAALRDGTDASLRAMSGAGDAGDAGDAGGTRVK